jgi:hypothetical protein
MLLQIPLLAKPSYTPSDFSIRGAHPRWRRGSSIGTPLDLFETTTTHFVGDP